jgi:hypothetical protein
VLPRFAGKRSGSPETASSPENAPLSSTQDVPSEIVGRDPAPGCFRSRRSRILLRIRLFFFFGYSIFALFEWISGWPNDHSVIAELR